MFVCVVHICCSSWMELFQSGTCNAFFLMCCIHGPAFVFVFSAVRVLYWCEECINPLAPNDVYIRRTAQLTSRRCILNIYSTNILTEYFKHAAPSPIFFLFKMPFIS